MTRKSIRTTRSCAEFAQHHNLSDDAAEELHELVRNGVSGGMGERYAANSPSLIDHDRSKWRKCGPHQLNLQEAMVMFSPPSFTERDVERPLSRR